MQTLTARARQGGELREETVATEQLLLRGASLKKTKWIVGMVMYTGKHTKVGTPAGARRACNPCCRIRTRRVPHRSRCVSTNRHHFQGD